MLKRFLVMFSLLAAMLLPTGCVSNESIGALIGVASTAIQSLLTVEGDTVPSNLTKDFSALQTAVVNFKPGSATSDINQFGNDVLTDLALIPVSTKNQELIGIVVSTIQAVINAVAPAPQTTAALAKTHSAATVKVKSTKTPVTDFKKAWNAAIAKQPTLAAAAIK